MTATPRPKLLDNLRALPAPVWILFAGSFVNRFGSFVMPFLILYLTRQGYSISKAGVAVGAYGAGHFLASLLGGHLADRIGRRNTIVLSMVSSAVTMLVLSQMHAYWALVFISFLAGTSSEMYRPAAHALIGDLVPDEHRVAAFGMYRFAINLGFAAGPATAGFLADRSFLYLFVGDAVTSIGYGIIAFLFLPHGLRTYQKHERSGEAIRVAMRDRPFLLFLAGSICLATIDFQIPSTVALHVKLAGFPSSVYGMLISLNGILIVVFELAIIAFIQRYPPRPFIALGYLFAGLGVALTGLSFTIPALAATVVLWTLGEMISSPAAAAYATQLAPEQYRGRYMGIWVMTWAVGMVAGPTLGTLILEHNPALLWTSIAAIGILGATLIMVRPTAHRA
jgi:MFS family permease